VRIRRAIEWFAFVASSAVILYAGVAAFYYASGPWLDYCWNARNPPVTSQRRLMAESMARWCALIGIPNEKRLGLHLADQSGDAVLVYYEPQNNRVAPVMQWRDEDHLNVDLGEVTWLTPQVSQRGHIKISYRYSGPEPSLE
jgi:hypothetical protein